MLIHSVDFVFQKHKFSRIFGQTKISVVNLIALLLKFKRCYRILKSSSYREKVISLQPASNQCIFKQLSFCFLSLSLTEVPESAEKSEQTVRPIINRLWPL